MRIAHGWDASSDRMRPSRSKGKRILGSDPIRQSCFVAILRRQGAEDEPTKGNKDQRFFLRQFPGAVYVGTDSAVPEENLAMDGGRKERREALPDFNRKKRHDVTLPVLWVDWWRISLRGEGAPTLESVQQWADKTGEKLVEGPFWFRAGHECFGLGQGTAEQTAAARKKGTVVRRKSAETAVRQEGLPLVLRTVFGSPFVPLSVQGFAPMTWRTAGLMGRDTKSDLGHAKQDGLIWDLALPTFKRLPKINPLDPNEAARFALESESELLAWRKCVALFPELPDVLAYVQQWCRETKLFPKEWPWRIQAQEAKHALLGWCHKVCGLLYAPVEAPEVRIPARKKVIPGVGVGAAETVNGMAPHEIAARDRRLAPLPNGIGKPDSFRAVAMTATGYEVFAFGKMSDVSKAPAPEGALATFIVDCDDEWMQIS